MLKKYLENGWEVVRKKRSHVMLRKGKMNETIPIHGNKGLEIKLLKKLEQER